MDISAYIESGILESYAMGLCQDNEAREVEAFCAQYPEIKSELQRIREALDTYALTYARTPQPYIRQRIFEVIEKETAPKARVVKLSVRNYQAAVAASVILLALSLAGNILIYNKYKTAREELTALNAEKSQLAIQMQATQVKFEYADRERAILRDPMVSRIMMKGAEKSPGSMAMVYWNKSSGEVFMEIKKLPMPAPGKQYQLWAIVDGKPVDAGMITMTPGDTSLHRMKDFDAAQAFAVTLEKEGGTPTPTLSEMYVIGNVSL